MPSIDTSGPRPWAGQATLADIRPGLLLTKRVLWEPGVPDETITEYVVLGFVHDRPKHFYVETIDMVDRFDAKFVRSGILDGWGQMVTARELGIIDDHDEWEPLVYCTVEGLYVQPGTPAPEFTLMALPDDINSEGLQELFSYLSHDGRHEAIDKLLALHEPADAMRLLAENMEARDITVVILRFGLHGEQRMRNGAVARLMGTNNDAASKMWKKIITRMRKGAESLI